MTPGARVAAAIEILDAIANGAAAEAALTRWARASRFAGSKDRSAIRDYVFDVLRNWRSDAVCGGSASGRGRMIGRLRAMGLAPNDFFTGEGHAPNPLNLEELAAGAAPSMTGDIWNLPDWLVAEFQASLGDSAGDVAQQLATRAPITLRVNTLKTDPAMVVERLSSDGILAVKNEISPTALTVIDNARRLRATAAFEEGWFEFQDASSQAFVDGLPSVSTALDYCAGGGG